MDKDSQLIFLTFPLHSNLGGADPHSIFQDHRSLWICPWHIASKWQNLVSNPGDQMLKHVSISLPPCIIKNQSKTQKRLLIKTWWNYTHGISPSGEKYAFFLLAGVDFSLKLKGWCTTVLPPQDLRTEFVFLLLWSNLVYLMLKKWKLS